MTERVSIQRFQRENPSPAESGFISKYTEVHSRVALLKCFFRLGGDVGLR
ncbi:MAG: hypothetical protein ACI4K5_02800 [Ruminococcus sp.]